jgi:hypothetical protein
MTFWLIAVPTAVALFALVWWSSGRARPDRRRRSIRAEVEINQGRVGTYDIRGDSGPHVGGGGF